MLNTLVLALAAAPGIHPGLHQAVAVLTYHEVVPQRTADSLWFYCSVPELENQLKTMERAHVHFITLDQLYGYLSHGTALPKKPVCITFADSYEGYYQYALPILRRHHVPSAQFVHTGFVGSPIGRPKLTWAQLKEIDRAGDVTIASQTVSHPLDLRNLTDAQLNHEMRDSKSALERHLGHTIRFVAYPNGKFDFRSEKAARAAGYVMACSEVTQPANQSPNIFAVNRYVHTKWQAAIRRLGK